MTIPRPPGVMTIEARPVAAHVQAAADEFVVNPQMTEDVVQQLQHAALLLQNFADGATHHDRVAAIKKKFMDQLALRVWYMSDNDRAAFLSIARESLDAALPTLN